MQSNVILDENIKTDSYQVIVTGITWSENKLSNYKGRKDFYNSLPEQTTVELPESLVKTITYPRFNDEIESYVYNHLTHRFNHMVYHCQIWLPFEEKETSV